ncbi:MarR family winged helix-turn-helix transcriptional regulator [Stakelama tenebrarum]|uniref:MarR family transcriptional regulator n=1 Tax=Stakelama tenebrarum TaxID=2711215 RepID=A0A6G6Y8E0_9SPHN|nr:helix-turn-helix domain-containing protein [Sphingosinithalassobacter tenebrarum]QIG80978.1 MarR family transcriptional regulator [Sphingosinithalassobacter tenebrarum]
MADMLASNRDPRVDLIAMVYRLHGAMRNRFAGPNANTGLVLLEALVLGAIVVNRDPPTVPEIGRMLGFTRQSIQRAVNKLIALELVEPRANPRHKRAPIFVATQAGRDRMREVQRPSEALAEELAAEFDVARATALRDELAALLSAVQRCASPTDPD